jgi:hypothetical protein
VVRDAQDPVRGRDRDAVAGVGDRRRSFAVRRLLMIGAVVLAIVIEPSGGVGPIQRGCVR